MFDTIEQAPAQVLADVKAKLAALLGIEFGVIAGSADNA